MIEGFKFNLNCERATSSCQRGKVEYSNISIFPMPHEAVMRSLTIYVNFTENLSNC